MFGFFDVGFSVFSLMFTLMFFIVIVIFILAAARGIGQWNKNNHSPRLAVSARVIGKREECHHHHHDNHMSTSTTYYATFEVESGDRIEFLINGWEYGQLAEGDMGKLSFQGTRYLGFVRQ